MSETSEDRVAPSATDPYAGERRTWLSGAWVAVVVGILALIVVLVFILENQQGVMLSFLVFHLQLPLGVALLFAAILGALIVVAIGGARIVQLRLVASRSRRRAAKPEPGPPEAANSA